MLSLTNQDYRSILDFVRDMPVQDGTFPRDILQLFERHFQVSVSLIILYQEDSNHSHKAAPQYDYIVRNLDPNQIRPYFHNFFKYDIFAKQRQRKDSAVASLRELMTPEELEHSPYYQYLCSLGIVHQACIFLRQENGLMATISLFRSQAEGDFTEEELQMFREVEPLITQRYRQIRLSKEAMSLRYRFDDYFSEVTMGAALLDHKGKILKANRTFNEYAQYIYENGHIAESFVTQDTVDISSRYVWGQKLLNYFGAKVISKPERVRIECLLYQFKLYAQAIYSQNSVNMNDVECQHLIFLVRQDKVRSEEMLDALKLLTPREMMVLSYLASGLNNTEIAEKMVISPFTVKTHLQNIYQKCQVSGRSELLTKLK